MNYGEGHHNTKLTNKDAEEIRIKYGSQEYSQRRLAEIYKCSEVAVWRIVNKKSFNHG